MKWTIDSNDPPGPIQRNRVVKALSELDHEHHTTLNRSGIFGCTEGVHKERSYGMTRYSIGCVNTPRPDVAAAQAALHTRFASTISRSNVTEFLAALAAALAVLEANRPVKDERQTQEQYDAATKANREEAEANNQRQAERLAAEEAPFIRLYARDAVKVTVPDGQLPVTVGLKFDNSDSMSDYYDRNACLGPCFLLGCVSRQAETESLARRMLAAYPEFVAGVGDATFTWHTEKYSGGHGNYLEGTAFDLPVELQALRKSYGSGGFVTHARWHVEFGIRGGGRFAEGYYAFKGYAGGAGVSPASSVAGTGSTGATVSLNSVQNGVEVRFPSKPDASIISELKANGFRWAMRSKCWYKKQSEHSIATAYRIAGATPPTTKPGSSPRGGSAALRGPDRFDMAVEDGMANACGL